MSDESVVFEVTLSERHRPTGDTEHFVGGVPMPPPARLRITQHDGEAGCSLLYLDEAGTEITDTWHQSLDDAMDQATFEFGVDPSEWGRVTDDG